MSVEPAIRRRRPKDRRDQILNVAADLFADRGFAAVSMQDIGDGTGITGGAIYRHFPSKDALLQALVVEIVSLWEQIAERTSEDAAARGEDALRARIESTVRVVAEHRGKVVTFLRERQRVEGDATAAIRQRVRALDRYWTDVIADATPGLTPADVTARHAALLGVVGAVSWRRAESSNVGIRARLVEGLVAATKVPHIDAPAAPRGRFRWTAPESRRQQIIRTAMTLFNQRGFHGVALNEVGDALGIAGPSIYEYFESKTDILLDAYDQAGGLVGSGVMAALHDATSADTALDLLIQSYAGVCHRYVDLISVTRHEGASLPLEERPRLTRRRRGLYEIWMSILREVRPDLSPSEAQVLVQSAFAAAITVAREFNGAEEMAPTTAAVVRAFLTPSH
jgi:AcrR family transcriptional regulator